MVLTKPLTASVRMAASLLSLLARARSSSTSRCCTAADVEGAEAATGAGGGGGNGEVEGEGELFGQSAANTLYALYRLYIHG